MPRQARDTQTRKQRRERRRFLTGAEGLLSVATQASHRAFFSAEALTAALWTAAAVFQATHRA